MRKRAASNTAHSQRMSAPMPPMHAYEAGMGIIRQRFMLVDGLAGENPLVRAEQIAFQVRKIVEMVAFSALSAVEYRNRETLAAQRTKDAGAILAWLNKKSMLKLPHAQRVTPSSDPSYKAVFIGHPSANIGGDELASMYSRASALVHERHPERLTVSVIDEELRGMEDSARRLRDWLWLHIIFHQGEGFLVQMGQFGSASFFGSIGRVGDLPSET